MLATALWFWRLEAELAVALLSTHQTAIKVSESAK
jgi:hypothetical protein